VKEKPKRDVFSAVEPGRRKGGVNRKGVAAMTRLVTIPAKKGEVKKNGECGSPRCGRWGPSKSKTIVSRKNHGSLDAPGGR